MNQNDFIRAVVSYFTEIEWTDTRIKKLNSLTDELLKDSRPAPLIKKVYVERKQPVVIQDAIMKIAKPSDIQEIAEEVCAKYQVPLEALKRNSSKIFYESVGGRRSDYLVTVRQEVAMLIKFRFPATPLQKIADFMAYRDHTSIIHLLRYRKAPDKSTEEVIPESVATSEGYKLKKR